MGNDTLLVLGISIGDPLRMDLTRISSAGDHMDGECVNHTLMMGSSDPSAYSHLLIRSAVVSAVKVKAVSSAAGMMSCDRLGDC